MTPVPAQLAEEYETFLRKGIKPEGAAERRKGVAMIDQAALMRLSGDILGTECTNSYWISTGGLNFIFLLTTKDSREVIARVCRPDMVGGDQWQSSLERRQKVLGEVATLTWLRKHTKIPVPTVYGYNTDSDCGVGSAFMLQERILGHVPEHKPLRDNPEVRNRFISQITEYYVELLRNPLPAIGTLMLDESGQDAVVGPTTFSFLANNNLSSTARGPFNTSLAWIKAFLEGQAAFLESEEFDERWRVWHRDPSDVPDRGLLQKQLEQVRDLVALYEQKHGTDKDIFILRHADLHLPNVLVAYDDPGKIVGIIDWEASQTVPLWQLELLPKVLTERPLVHVDDDVAKQEMEDAFWRDVLMHVPHAEDALKNGRGRRIVRQLVSDRDFFAGPSEMYGVDALVELARELLGGATD